MGKVISQLGVLFILSLLGLSNAEAFDAIRCNNDNDPVPSYASGRDANGCLLIDSGTGVKIPFDYEEHDRNSVDLREPMPGHGGTDLCSTGKDCALVLSNVNFDDYLNASTGTGGGDALNWSGKYYKYILFRNVGFGNTWKCQGGTWKSPTGLMGCTAGNVSSGHNDSLQMDGMPVNGGWAVFQEGSRLVNANDMHMITQMNTPQGPLEAPPGPSYVFQDFFAGYEKDWGSANDWIADCKAMGDEPCGPSGTVRMQVGSNSSDIPARQTWFINSWSQIKLALFRTEKIIVVNGGTKGGCNNTSGCTGGPIGYKNGWPAPLGDWYADLPGSSPSAGPGVCPEGLISPRAYPVEIIATRVYCYTSIEKALADTKTTSSNVGDCPDCPHERPPFIQLSNTGWENPPVGNMTVLKMPGRPKVVN